MGKIKRLTVALAFGGLTALTGCAVDAPDGPAASSEEGAAADPHNKIAGSVEEWAVRTTSSRALEGDVTFAITNFGTATHEFLVVRTDLAPGKIPLGADDRFSEEGEGLTVVDEIAEFPVNTTGTLKVNLAAGKYQLLCNIKGHYRAGMWKAFEVVKGEKPVVDAPPADSAAGDQDAVSNDVRGSVTEWAVNVDAGKAKKGDVTFTIENRGTIQHEFLVVKTTYGPGEIPLGANNRFDEEDPGLSVVDEIPEWPAGESGTLKVKLEPGKYELLCNIEGHYKNGMHRSFEVID